MVIQYYLVRFFFFFFFFSSRRRHTRSLRDWSSDVCSSDLLAVRQSFFGVCTNIRLEQIYSASRMLSEITGVSVPPNKAVVGSNAFAHEAGDRKSTRLNSSHVEISYAVFCLKKKKIKKLECL